ncbi:WD40 repeat domain-containing protein [Nostoc sp.]|uniref:WD40 repeat domain-containing protein n=1 Tax=Nostoc sp. TaxID=1180 RepID=UPI002FF8F5EC
MVDNSQEPKEHDISLCGHSKFPADGVVLGELERINQLMAYGRIEQKVDALLDAFEYGQAALEIIIHSLHDSSREVREAAYFLLQESTELSAKEVLQEYIPYEFFKCLHAWNGETVMSLCFSISSDWKTLVSVDNGKCNLWDLITGQLIRTLDIDLPNDDVDDVTDYVNIAFIPDTQTLLIASEGIVSVLDIQTNEIIRTLKGNYAGSFATNLLNKTTIYLGRRDRDDYSDSEHPVQVWNLQTGQLVSTIYGHNTGEESDLIINPSEQYITIMYCHFKDAHGFYDIVLKMWDLQTGERIDTFNVPLSKSDKTFFPTLSEDGKTLVTCSVDASIKVWNLQTKKIIHIFQGHRLIHGHQPIFLNPQANILASGGQDNRINTIILWDLIRGEKIHTLQGSAPVAFSTDAKVIVSGGADNTIIVWDLQTGEKLCILEGHSSRIVDIAISPDGQTIVSSSDVSSYFANDATIKVWGV